MQTLCELLRITGVDDKFFKFIDERTLNFSFEINMQPTPHSPNLQCFGIMFKDKFGKYYYTGDTKDIAYIRKLCNDETVKTIYTEVAEETYDVHIKYDDIIDLDKNCYTILVRLSQLHDHNVYVLLQYKYFQHYQKHQHLIIFL